MCREAGTITGELEISTRRTAEGLETTVRYVGADEWYTVEDSPVPSGNAESLEPGDLHERVVEHLTTPGPVVEGNEQPVFLSNFRWPLP